MWDWSYPPTIRVPPLSLSSDLDLNSSPYAVLSAGPISTGLWRKFLEGPRPSLLRLVVTRVLHISDEKPLILVTLVGFVIVISVDS